MAKLLLIGDPHLQMNKFGLVKDFLTWIEDVTSLYHPDVVVNLGDTFHNHGILRSELLSEFKQHVDKVSSQTQYIYILGNHDMASPRDATYHALQVFKDSNMLVVDKVFNDQSLGITFVPYLPNDSDFPTETLPICVAHQTFMGCDFGGYRPEDGVNPDSISADLIISGHIHKKQQYGKVFYPGSPYSQGLKDLDQIKGVHLFDTETLKITFIESPFSHWRSLERDIGDVSNIEGNLDVQNTWVIKLKGPRNEVSSYLDSKEWKNLSKKYSLVVRVIPTDSNKIEKTSIKSTTIDDILIEYVDKVYDGGISKEKIKHTMRQLFDKNRKNACSSVSI